MLALSLVPAALVISSPKPLIPKTLTLTPPLLRNRSPIHNPHPHPKFLCCFSAPQISPIQVADLVEKDYSFLDFDSTSSQQFRIVSIAGIGEDSRILISFPTVGFVDRVAGSGNCELIVAVHESLFVLAMIKEMNDAVRCLQGGILDVVPEKFLPFDVVRDWLSALMKGGASLSESTGNVILTLLTSRLPDKITLKKVASDHSFQITEFVDESDLYLAVLKAI